MPRCFLDPSRPANVHYFANPKSWMKSDVTQTVLTLLNKKLSFEQRKVILFLNNATCHPESMAESFSQIKIVFLTKNTTAIEIAKDVNILMAIRWSKDDWREVLLFTTIKNCFE